MKNFLLFILLVILFTVITACQKQTRVSRVYKDAPQNHAPLRPFMKKATKKGFFSSKNDKSKKTKNDAVNNKENIRKVETEKTLDKKKGKTNE